MNWSSAGQKADTGLGFTNYITDFDALMSSPSPSIVVRATQVPFDTERGKYLNYLSIHFCQGMPGAINDISGGHQIDTDTQKPFCKYIGIQALLIYLT